MVFLSLKSLSDLCSIRIAYLMWTRQDVTQECSKEVPFYELVDVVLDDVRKLPLPDKMKSRISMQVKPAGKHLLSLINLWLYNRMLDSFQKGLTNDMLYDCLVLNGDGLINQRKTAKKILGSRMMHNVFAFRFACINFLEEEVSKLWILVKEYFLNNITRECEQANTFIAQKERERSPMSLAFDLTGHYYSHCIRKYDLYDGRYHYELFPFSTELDEVLFWIAFCLSKENSTSMEEIPHYFGGDIGWYGFALDFAAISCNVACFEYLNNICKIEYNYADIIEKILCSPEEERKPQCFVFHYLLLNSEQKAMLFTEYQYMIIGQFLQWSLSLTFLENLEGLWNLFPDLLKRVTLREIFYILFHENVLLHAILHDDFCKLHLDKFHITNFSTPGMQVPDHLAKLFVSLWEISSDCYKMSFLNYCLFEEIRNWNGQQKFLENFETSGLKGKLFQLFFSNGEAILELFETGNVKESLKSLVSKHMPQHFEDLDNRCISFLETPTVLLVTIRKEIMKSEVTDRSLKERKPQNYFIFDLIDCKFWNYIKNVSCSSIRNS